MYIVDKQLDVTAENVEVIIKKANRAKLLVNAIIIFYFLATAFSGVVPLTNMIYASWNYGYHLRVPLYLAILALTNLGMSIYVASLSLQSV